MSDRVSGTGTGKGTRTGTRSGPGDDVRAAYAAWSAVAEPGDEAARILVDSLGPVDALEWVRAGQSSLTAAAARLHGVLDKEVAMAMVRAHERWERRLDYAEQPLLERAGKLGVRVVVPGDDQWPEVFDVLGATAPFALWVRGDGNVGGLWNRSVAVVGARASTSYGEHMTAEITSGIADAGWTVISGGAYGIDAVAHRTAVACGAATVAVMAGGVDRLYPAGNETLLRAVMESGCVVAEVPPGFAPHRSRFLQRNRLIACASATVVVEAAYRSGANNTAHQAAQLSRPVAAVPGAVTSASSAGCHELIRSGAAVLVTTAAHVLELAAPLTESREERQAGEHEAPAGVQGLLPIEPQPRPEPPNFESPQHRAVFDAVAPRVRSVDEVARGCGLDLAAVHSALARLEADGLVMRERGGWRKVPARLSAKKGT